MIRQCKCTVMFNDVPNKKIMLCLRGLNIYIYILICMYIQLYV